MEENMAKLSPAVQKFVLHWGEMGTRWGVNRTVAQIHALLYVSAKPLNAEEIAEALSLARSNVSNSLRELQGWGIIKVVHLLGDRRDHFESLKDVWKMFQIVLDERKRREIDPTITMLQESIAEMGKERVDVYAKRKLQEMFDFFKIGISWYSDVRRLPAGSLYKLAKLGGKVQEFLSKQSKS